MAEGGGDQIKGADGDKWEAKRFLTPINNPPRNTGESTSQTEMSQSECFPVHRLVWELLSKQETKKYIDELLKQEDISCEWKLHDSCHVTVHSKQKGLSSRAATKIRESILNKAYRVARYPVISRVEWKSTFNLTEEEYSLLILKTVEEELQIAATADIMDKIDKQLSDMEKQQNSVQACSQSTRRETMSAKLPGQVHPVTSQYVQLSKLEMSFVKKLKFLEEFFAKSKLNWAIDDKNCQVVIKATEVDDVVTSLKREIKNFCAGVSKSKQNVHVQGECWMLFQFKSMHNYIENRVQENGLLCVWEIQNDDVCVYALNEGDAQKAAQFIGTLMSQHSVAGMDLKHSDLQEILQKHKEKVILLGKDTDDPTLVLRVDVEKEIQAVIEKCQTTTAKMRSQEQLQSSEECIEFLLTKHKPFISTIQKDCRVTVQQSPDKSCLTITGEKGSVTKAKATMQTYIGNISERVLNLNYLPETLEDKTKKKKFEHMNNCQISVKEKDIVRPRPSYVWIEKSVHLMLVQGNIEDSDADVIVCPVDLEMNLMTSGEKIFRKGGDVLHDNFKLHAADVVVKGDLYLSAVTGNLHSPYIMYSAFPSTSQSGSSMPTTKSVFNNKTEKIFKKADSEELNSLALPLNVSNVDVVADYFGESLGSTKCLKQIYLYCADEVELNHAKSHFEQTLGCSFNFSSILHDLTSRNQPSAISVEIVKGSLIDQKVDVLVNSTSPDLKLSQGYVSNAILKTAGLQIQRECRRKYAQGIGCGCVAVTSAGNFKHVKQIFHVVLPYWIPTADFSLMVLELLVSTCLQNMDELSLDSIAFPALGIGNLEYPVQLVGKTMFDTIHEYSRRNSHTRVKKVMMVVMEDNVAEVFENLQKYPSLGFMQTKESDHPCQQILEARMPLKETFIQIQVLPFHKCLWQTQALVEIFSIDSFPSGKGKQTDVLQNDCFDMKWITQSSGYYLLMRVVTDAASFKKDVEKTLGTALFQRISSIGFCLAGDQENLPLKKQADNIKEMLSENKYSSNKYLQEVKILFPSREPYDNLLLATKKKEKSNLEKTKAFLGRFVGRKPSWRVTKCIRQADTGIKVTVVAESQSIEEVLMNLKRSKASHTKENKISESPAVVSVTSSDNANKGQGARMKKLTNHTHHEDDSDTSLDCQVFETIEAVVNKGIISQWETTMKRPADVKKDGHIVCKDLSSLQKVDGELKSIICDNSTSVHDTEDHLSSSQEDFEHVPDINIGMTEETFLALQFFCSRDASLRQAVNYRDGMLQISCNERENKKAIQTCIESKLKHIEIMNKDDVSFTPAEEPKIKQTIRQIHDSVEGVYCYQLEKDQHSMVHLMAQSYGQLQTAKHKIALGLGRIKQTETRRNRRFDNTPLHQNEEESTSTDRRKFSQSFTGRSQSWKSEHTTGYGSVRPVDFTTPEGLLVRVYPGSILHLDVDCIVNAANENLQHGGGVAYVISNAAGYDFDQESRDYVYNHGPLRVGEVCTTTAGDLKYKGVIHSVGPRWHDYSHDQKWICLDVLKTAVKKSLEEADIQMYKSIAIPAISSGIFGVPKEHCTQQYYRAVEEYSRTKGRHSTLTEVHFIDKDTQMCELIQTTFTKCFTGNAGSSNFEAGPGGRGGNFSSSVMSRRNTTPVLQRSKSVSSDGDGSSVDPPNVNQPLNVEHSSSRGQRFEYQISNNLTVHIIHGNIVEIEADAIVSPENVQCDSTGSIAREIARVAGQGYRDIDQSELRLAHRKPKLTEVLDTLAGHSHFKYVLNVVAPKWDSTAVEDQSYYWEDLKTSYNNIFTKFDEKRLDITSLALPILGTGKMEQPVPVISISKMLAKICKSYAEKANARKTLYFCSNDSVAAKTLRDIFEKEFNKGNDGTETDTDKTGHGRGAGLEVTEDCCICMDTMTKPKKLSCGHMFCTECIDQQFKYKPACPQCGAVHGKITGDQPPGTMTMKTTKTYWGGGSSLPGYEGCGIINITYSFPPGKQGPEHPTPGKHYQGITRPGFLPDNDKGRLVAKLLKIAFDRKLVFTIGRSRTTGHDGVVTWNDIHHKTRMDGGPQAFGYPDPTYLDRVLDELKAKGVTEESLNDP